MKIFTEEQRIRAEQILKKNEIMPLSKLYSSEIQNLAVEWSYYSGKIEGNTYTYVETETLLKDGMTSPKRYDDAKMLKNLYNAFITEIEYAKNGGKDAITEVLLYRLHSFLTDDLVDNKERGLLRTRPVRISGTDYIPPKDIFEIQEKLSQIIILQNKIENPLEKAIFLHCNLARLQPFIDGNKRTARLVESIVLMQNDIVPILSTKIEHINAYRSALIHFYETEDYSLYVDYFLAQKENFLDFYQ